MSEDPFARFERSRGGLLIPIAVFLIGAALTLIALQTVHRLGNRLSETEPPPTVVTDRDDAEPLPES